MSPARDAIAVVISLALLALILGVAFVIGDRNRCERVAGTRLAVRYCPPMDDVGARQWSRLASRSWS